ncbi:MAG: hypothetical protein FJ128_05785 [Deltaproteobacteria bacterium]|nr:hypothetical protein [Deltaproteobacteria bacterium]
MKRGLALILALVVVAGVAGAGLYWRWVNSPVYSLYHMVSALKARNYDDFFNYLIIKDIMAGMVDASSKDLLLKGDPKEGDWAKFGRQLGQKLASQFIPKLFEGFEKEMRAVVEAYLRQLTDQQIQALAEAVDLAEVQTQGDEAQVVLKEKKTGERLGLTMRRHPRDRVWRIVGLSYEDFKRIIKREFK